MLVGLRGRFSNSSGELPQFANCCRQTGFAGLFLVPISEAVPILVFRTERSWFGIVHAMPHRWQRP